MLDDVLVFLSVTLIINMEAVVIKTVSVVNEPSNGAPVVGMSVVGVVLVDEI